MNGAGGVTGATERRRTAMPNWCHNSMEIAGPVDEITRFKQACLRVVYTGEPAQLDFSAIKPMPNIFDGDPAEANDWGWARFDWVCKHWGTDCNAQHFHASRDEPGHYECHFDTAWSPPIPVWRKLGEMFPTLEFSLSGFEPLENFAFRGTIRDGKLELLDVPVIWETVDPKTGKTVSGTGEEIGAVLGERGGIATARAGGSEWPHGETSRRAGCRRSTRMSGSEAAARERRRSDCPF
jgi:Api92-like protein with ferredoxin domain